MVCQELIEPRAIPISKSEFIGISLIVKELSTYENSEGRELVKITFVIVLVVLFVIVIVYSTTSFKETIVGIEVILRSEEHTSELQSRQYLVCRLLLEKKKKKQ